MHGWIFVTVECYCIYIYYCWCTPTTSSPPNVRHIMVSAFFLFWTPLFPRNRLSPQDRVLASKFIWRYYTNAFGAPRFSVKKLKMQESAYSPGGSKILQDPHLQQQRPNVTKTMVFHLFFYRTTFVTRLRPYCLFCPGAPKGRICDFHDLNELFSKFLLFRWA